MKILAIETSCDETAIAILEAEGGLPARLRGQAQAGLDEPKFKVISHNLYSQASKHAEFGGVYPNLAKREHAINLIPLLENTLKESNLLQVKSKKSKVESAQNIGNLLERNPELLEQTLEFLSEVETPDIDVIAVTQAWGLEPAIWVGLNFARALSVAWQKPFLPINHLEGHIFSVLLEQDEETTTRKIKFPSVALIISGGHTELILMREMMEYEMLGQTKDDAVGEAFDKVARMMDLPYPGGPQISRLAENARQRDRKFSVKLPRPMINSDDLDFSFSGLKTAVLYYIKKHEPLSDEHKAEIALEFEEAVTEVLISKTEKALIEHNPRTLIIGGGVIADKKIREAFEELARQFPNLSLLIPGKGLSTDNAVMIGLAAYFRALAGDFQDPLSENIKAEGSTKLTS